jgi:hypothetical protein
MIDLSLINYSAKHGVHSFRAVQQALRPDAIAGSPAWWMLQ